MCVRVCVCVFQKIRSISCLDLVFLLPKFHNTEFREVDWSENFRQTIYYIGITGYSVVCEFIEPIFFKLTFYEENMAARR